MKIPTRSKPLPKMSPPSGPDPRVLLPLPPEWGHDGITAYLDGCRGNQLATFDNKADFRDLILIDAMFRKLLESASSLKPKVPLQFAFRAHSAYLAAVGVVAAGQIYEAQALMRLCLEHGAYGFYIGGEKDRWNIWQNRSSSEAARKACVNEFRAVKVKAHIEANAPHYAQL